MGSSFLRSLWLATACVCAVSPAYELSTEPEARNSQNLIGGAFAKLRTDVASVGEAPLIIAEVSAADAQTATPPQTGAITVAEAPPIATSDAPFNLSVLGSASVPGLSRVGETVQPLAQAAPRNGYDLLRAGFDPSKYNRQERVSDLEALPGMKPPPVKFGSDQELIVSNQPPSANGTIDPSAGAENDSRETLEEKVARLSRADAISRGDYEEMKELFNLGSPTLKDLLREYPDFVSLSTERISRFSGRDASVTRDELEVKLKKLTEKDPGQGPRAPGRPLENEPRRHDLR